MSFCLIVCSSEFPFVLSLYVEQSRDLLLLEDTGSTDLQQRAMIHTTVAALDQMLAVRKAKSSCENPVSSHSTPTLPEFT